jgi:glutamyl-tRNA reductase
MTGKRTNQLFQKALHTAKHIRTKTAIGSGAASVGSVAVQHAQRIFHSELSACKVMVIGAGAMAEKCLRHLVKQGVSQVVVVNRSFDKAEALAGSYGGTAVSFGRCLDAMTDIDIVITSTGCPHILLERGDVETVMAERGDRPLFIVDIAVPRDVDPEARNIPGVHLSDIGHLDETVQENIRYREQDLDQCRAIIRAKAASLKPREHATTTIDG